MIRYLCTTCLHHTGPCWTRSSMLTQSMIACVHLLLLSSLWTVLDTIFDVNSVNTTNNLVAILTLLSEDSYIQVPQIISIMLNTFTIQWFIWIMLGLNVSYCLLLAKHSLHNITFAVVPLSFPNEWKPSDGSEDTCESEQRFHERLLYEKPPFLCVSTSWELDFKMMGNYSHRSEDGIRPHYWNPFQQFRTFTMASSL